MGAIITNKEFISNKSISVQEIKKLSVLTGKDSFFYAGLSETNEVITYKKEVKQDITRQFGDWVLEHIKKDQHQFDGVHQVEVGVLHSQFTLVPVTFFREEYKELILKRNVHLPPAFDCWVDSLTTRDYVKVLYSTPSFLHHVGPYFPCRVHVKHLLTGLARLFFDCHASNLEWSGLIHVRNDQLMMIIFRDGKLIYSNLYVFFAEDDFYYYISLALSFLKINPNAISFFLAGEIYSGTPKYLWLQKRIKKLYFASLDKIVPGIKIKKETPAHELFDLMSLIL